MKLNLFYLLLCTFLLNSKEGFADEKYEFPHVHFLPGDTAITCGTDFGQTLCSNGLECTTYGNYTTCNDGSAHYHYSGNVTDCSMDQARCIRYDHVTRCDDGTTCYHERKSTTCTKI